MKHGFKVMDSDMHIIEPPDLWQCYIEPEFKDQAPRGTTNSVADLGMVGPDGTPWGRNPKHVQSLGQNAGVVTASPATRNVLSHTETWGGRGTRTTAGDGRGRHRRGGDLPVTGTVRSGGARSRPAPRRRDGQGL